MHTVYLRWTEDKKQGQVEKECGRRSHFDLKDDGCTWRYFLLFLPNRKFQTWASIPFSWSLHLLVVFGTLDIHVRRPRSLPNTWQIPHLCRSFGSGCSQCTYPNSNMGFRDFVERSSDYLVYFPGVTASAYLVLGQSRVICKHFRQQ